MSRWSTDGHKETFNLSLEFISARIDVLEENHRFTFVGEVDVDAKGKIRMFLSSQDRVA